VWLTGPNRGAALLLSRKKIEVEDIVVVINLEGTVKEGSWFSSVAWLVSISGDKDKYRSM
jgi:hypothetical protein